MSLEWGVYRQKPYGWQVRRQWKAAWAAEEAVCPGRAARWVTVTVDISKPDRLPRACGTLRCPDGRKVAPSCFRPRTGLGLPAEIA